ncbi:MAG: xanthine phosphoribosyltransferase [Clostridia bacterium]|nr:xanthine phosphoribosyltransferase [Clostridia bacterium]
MKEFEEKVLKDGIVINDDILKVDNFLNHQIDVNLIMAMAKDVKEFFGDIKVDKVLTIEASGIAIAFAVAQAYNNVPVVFAKKSKSATVGDDVYATEIKSFTRNTVSRVTVCNKYLNKGENVLIVDDFLAEGNAAMGLMDLCNQACAKVTGYATAVEKEFQGGRLKIEEKGVKVYSAARVKGFKNNKPIF